MKQLCQVMQVSRSGYYDWRGREPSRRAQANQHLLAEITSIFDTSGQTYGSPRVWAALRRRLRHIGRNRVARLMREAGLVARPRRRYRPITTQRNEADPVVANILNRDFTASAPLQTWLADISYIETRRGWLYLAVVLDLFSRKVVGWSLADHMRTALVTEALTAAVSRWQPPSGLLHHSDRGSQYTSDAYQTLLADHHFVPSMSRAGDCYDNAVVESFFGTLKSECASAPFASHLHARQALFEYIEVWYNRQRLHSTLGYLSPIEFEQQFLDNLSVRQTG